MINIAEQNDKKLEQCEIHDKNFYYDMLISLIAKLS